MDDEKNRGPASLAGRAQSGLGQALDLVFVRASESEVVVDMTISERHLQPMGIVHGGVYCSLVETVCSVGAHLASRSAGLLVVGVDNHTSFLRAQRQGTLRTTGRPLVGGRRTQLWEATIENERGELVATGRVRMIGLEQGSSLAGEGAQVKVND